jgi:hypothetical protein
MRKGRERKPRKMKRMVKEKEQRRADELFEIFRHINLGTLCLKQTS